MRSRRCPSFITRWTFSRTDTSSSGLPTTEMTSARLPLSREPASSSMPSRRALQCRHPDGLKACHTGRYQKADLVGYFPDQPVRANRDLEVRVNSLGQSFPNERPLLSKSFPQLPAMQVVEASSSKKMPEVITSQHPAPFIRAIASSSTK